MEKAIFGRRTLLNPPEWVLRRLDRRHLPANLQEKYARLDEAEGIGPPPEKKSGKARRKSGGSR